MIFEYKENKHAKSMANDELLERLETRPAIMLACFDGRGVQAAAPHLAKSAYRAARELEHRGYDPLAISAQHPKDICTCGDYREQHHYNGVCLMNGLGHCGAPDCFMFNLAGKCEE